MSQPPTPCGQVNFRHHAGSAVVSIQTNGGPLTPTVEVRHETENDAVAAGGSGGSSNAAQIIIHKFLDESGTPDGRQQEVSQSPQQHHHHHHHHLPGGSGSITILTPSTQNTASSAVSRINICINNHYPMPLIEPNRDVRRYQFGLSDDVLVNVDDDDDDRFYLGTIIAIAERNCLVQFDDGTERWSAFDELTKLSTLSSDASRAASNSQPLCVVCKEHDGSNRTVYVCDSCSRGYHRQCRPSTDTDGRDGETEDNSWLCSNCSSSTALSVPSEMAFLADMNSSISDVDQLPFDLAPLTNKDQLPYDLDKLDWDDAHRVNTDNQYCYCGEDGDWAKEMIQCDWCQQWFHGRCIRSLQYPIFLGDPFYVFLCSICNHGHEFVRRLEMTYSDLAHLVLYNLMMRNGQRLFDLDRTIMPYIEDNMRTLQVPEEIVNASPATRKVSILHGLNNRSVFVNGKEVNKSPELWTLRYCVTPRRVSHRLPIDQTVTENLLERGIVAGAIKFRFLPRVHTEKNYVSDALSRERMTGIKYSQPPYSEEDPRPRSLVYELKYDALKDMATPSAQSHILLAENACMSYATYSSEDGRAASTSSGNGSFAAMTCPPGHLPSGHRRKYAQKPSYLQTAICDCTVTPESSILDVLFPPPANFIGKNNPFYEDSNLVARKPPRQALVVKRRLNAKDLQNLGRGKKRKLNNGVAINLTVPVAIPVPAPTTRKEDNERQARAAVVPNFKTKISCLEPSRSSTVSPSITEPVPPPVEESTPAAIMDPVPLVAAAAMPKSREQANVSGRLRPRAGTNYSDSRQYKRRKDQGVTRECSVSSETSRPSSSLSSSDYMGSCSLSTTGGSGSAPRQIESPIVSFALSTTWKRHWKQKYRGKMRAIRTLPDGRKEYLIERQK